MRVTYPRDGRNLVDGHILKAKLRVSVPTNTVLKLGTKTKTRDTQIYQTNLTTRDTQTDISGKLNHKRHTYQAN